MASVLLVFSSVLPFLLSVSPLLLLSLLSGAAFRPSLLLLLAWPAAMLGTSLI